MIDAIIGTIFCLVCVLLFIGAIGMNLTRKR